MAWNWTGEKSLFEIDNHFCIKASLDNYVLTRLGPVMHMCVCELDQN